MFRAENCIKQAVYTLGLPHGVSFPSWARFFRIIRICCRKEPPVLT
jgi:hypothetical protein